MDHLPADHLPTDHLPADHLPADHLQEAKRRLRSELRSARNALEPPERAVRSAAIARRLDALPELAGATTIAAYAATPFEVDLDPWLRALLARDVVLALPVVRGGELALAVVADLGDLVEGWRGLREPGPEAPQVDPQDVDVAVVPGLGFDAAGGRLGHGGGHIDRLLAALRPATPAIGVAFAVQVVAAVPMGKHDAPVDVVVTEESVLRTR